MADNPMKRQYIMLKPMATGANGFARLEAQTNRMLIQLTCKELKFLAQGLRVFLYAGEGMAHELGRAPVNGQGQATLSTDLDWRDVSLSPSRLQAILILSDDSIPKPLLIGLCAQQSAGSLMDAKNAMLSLCEKLSMGSNREAPADADALKPAPAGPPAPASAPATPAPTPASASTLQKNPPKDAIPQEVFLSAIDLNAHRAKTGQETPSIMPVPDEPEPDKLPAPVRTGNDRPVDRLRPLIWPPNLRQLPAFFEQYPPVAPFNLPGWRFVRVPMRYGGHFAVGYQARDGRVARIAYAVPGIANQPPPQQFYRYRFFHGQDGQGYWTLGQEVKG